MAISPFISNLKASGTYRRLFDRSRSVAGASNVIPIIFGFSKKGLFNTAVFCPDSEFFISNFGSIDYSLERKGSFFHRSALELLEQGPIFAINLYGLTGEAPETTAAFGTEDYYNQLNDEAFDLTDYKSFSLGSSIGNKSNAIEPVSRFYNRERFWFADTEKLNSVAGSDETLMNFVNLSQKSVSVITKKSDITGFNIKAEEWYGKGNVPEFMNPNDLISDFFVDVFIFEGDFTNYKTLAIDPVFGKYFDPNKGFRKEFLQEFSNLPQVNLLGEYQGAVIPDFIDKNGTNRYIQALVNRDTTVSGVLCSINEEVFDNEKLSGTKIDLVGHNIEKATNEGRTNIEFLSYKDSIVSDITFNQRELEITESGLASNSTQLYTIDGTIASADVTATPDGTYIITDDATNPNGIFDILSGSETLVQEAVDGALAFNSTSQEYLLFDGTSWATAATDSIFVDGTTMYVGPTTTLFTALTADYSISELADHVFLKNTDSKYSKILQATESFDYIELSIEQINTETIVGDFVTDVTPENYEVIVDPVYFDYDAADSAYLVIEGTPEDRHPLYENIVNGTIVTGDRVTYVDTVSSEEVTRFIQISDLIDNENFDYPAASTDSDKVQGFKVEFFETSQLTNKVTTGIPGFATGTELTISTLKGSLNESFPVTPVTDKPNEFVLGAEFEGEIRIGQFIVSSPGSSTTNAPSRLTRVNKITTLPGGDLQIRTDEEVFLNNGSVERYLPIEDFASFYDMTHLFGFRIKERILPQAGTGTPSIYNVLTNTNLYNTLKDRSIIRYRYIVDTFNKGLVAESKSILTSLAAEYKDAFAICNSPSAKEFAESADPVFTDAPTASNPEPELNTRFIATGGNQSLNPQTTYSLPSEFSGGAYGAFYFPNLVVNERNKTFTVPPAAYVAKNFIQKHTNGNAWDIVAGKRRGLVSGRNVVGVEYVLTSADREYLEPFGLNTIVNEPGTGLKITSNQTAKQQVTTALSYANVTEAIIEIQKGIERILSAYLWEFNTAGNRLEIKTLADQFMEAIKLANGVYAYENVMNNTNNPPELIDQQKGVIDTYVEPVKGLGILVQRTTILNTGQIESGDFQRL